jgi:hypothetical protein
VSARTTVAAGLALAAIAVGCGGDDEGAPIPNRQATELLGQLDSVSSRIANGSTAACRNVIEGGDTNVDTVQRIIDSLPASVDGDVRDALEQSFDRLFELVGEKCADIEQGQTDTTPTETTPPATETTPTETTPPATETTPTETTPPSTTPEGPTTPTTPGDFGGGGGGSGGAEAQGDQG